ncbi:oxidoreductase [Caulobacter sp. HMWF009]|nr:oxidoreductase [Caulobacter sp. HMWF009]PTT11284.1 oxidoreductase [Caulobacter sp. HMWF025]
MKTAFIGLGVMGYPMAGHLKGAGHEVSVFNRSPAKAQAWATEHGGATFATVAEAVAGCDLVLLCVGNDDDVRAVVAQCLPAMADGGVIVDHTTTSAVVAREMAVLAREGGRDFVDAPVSGGQAGAVNGQLTIMAGGDAAAYARVEPVISVYAKAVRRMGEVGTGQLTKMCNQIAIAGVVQGVAEALHFAKRAGLPTDDVLAAISKGSAQSWQMENRWPTMARGEFDFGFAVDWMRKDLGIALVEADRNGARLESTALIDQFYAEVQAMGGNRWDTSSLVARLEK